MTGAPFHFEELRETPTIKRRKRMLYIGSRIQEYRKKAELSQEEFADKIGVSRQAVSKWERDKAYPDLDRLVCICEILDVQMDELIYGEERKNRVN